MMMKRCILLALFCLILPTAGYTKECKQGKACGNSCIATWKNCRLEEKTEEETIGEQKGFTKKPDSFSTQVDMTDIAEQQAQEIEKLDSKQLSQRERYLPNYKNLDSKIIIISMPDDEFEIQDAAAIGATITSSGGKVEASIGSAQTDDDYLYEWISKDDTRIFSSTKPHWYANPNYPKENKPITKVYNRFGRKIDDTSEEGLLERKIILQQQIQSAAAVAAEKARRHWQAKVDAGIINIGMTTKEVLMIWGKPEKTTHDINGTTFIYTINNKADTTVRFRDGTVYNIDYE